MKEHIETLEQCRRMVGEFHNAFAITRFATPFDADIDTRRLRADLHAEEFAEWIAAGSPLETLDALCDIVYVHAGTLDQLSIETPAILPTIHTMQHIIPRGVAMLRRQTLCEHTGPRTLYEAALSAVKYSKSVLRPGLFEKAFAEVHRSNMAKLWTKEEVEVLKAEMDRRETFRFNNDGVQILERVAIGCVVKDLGGKIMKPPSWTPPNLAQFI
jgi:predicted HAD superfamily Cof-like phosphohydrolase